MEKNMQTDEQYMHEPRFYFIRVKNIKNISNNFPQNKKYRLVFRLGDKSSQTNFQLGNIRKISQKDLIRFKDQAHMFCYQAEQIMIISLGEDNKKASTIGYSNILLTPLIKMPHTHHQLTINMVWRNKDKSINKEISAILEIQLYFLLKFKAKLQIQPLFANLTRNTASFGQMKPFIHFRMNNRQVISDTVQNGGIHPKWPAYYLMKNVNNPLDLSTGKNYNGPYSFYLDSVGNQLEIIMYSLGMFGGNPDQIGRAAIKLQYFGFFKKPNHEILFQQKQAITLFYEDKSKKQNDGDKDNDKNKIAGKLAIKSRLIFQIEQTRITED